MCLILQVCCSRTAFNIFLSCCWAKTGMYYVTFWMLVCMEACYSHIINARVSVKLYHDRKWNFNDWNLWTRIELHQVKLLRIKKPCIEAPWESNEHFLRWCDRLELCELWLLFLLSHLLLYIIMCNVYSWINVGLSQAPLQLEGVLT